MNVFWCKLFGHKWKDWVCTHTRTVFNNSLIAPGYTEREYGHNTERKHCARCGELNPMFGEK